MMNQTLLAHAVPAKDEILLIAGEAGSHCVRATTLDILESLSADARTRVRLLTDCISPVSGFEEDMREFFAQVKDQGVVLVSSEEVRRDLLT